MWSVPRVAWAPAILGILIFVAALWLAFAQISYTRCQAANESREFFGNYLDSQVGKPVSEAAGFEKLSPDQKAFVLSFAPVFDAGRETRMEYARKYHRDFPIQHCSLWAV